MKVNVIIACGGSGSRTGLNYNKILAKIGGKSVIYHTVSQFYALDFVSKIVLPARSADIQQLLAELQVFEDKIVICDGGDTRTASIKNGISHCDDCDVISIHDGARPFVSRDIILDSIESASRYGSGISACPQTDSVAMVEDGIITAPLDRSKIWRLQTPQSFRASEIKKAYDMIQPGEIFTDDSAVYAKYIAPCKISSGSAQNKKITYAEDLLTFENCFIGVGYDTHQLVENRDLILGGIKIPHSKGLLGHSDADVLTHAIMDAIFGAVGERDIGYLFPDSDPKYKGISSIELLKQCLQIVRNKGFEVHNINSVIMCERPKLSKIIPDMAQNLASVIGISADKISISATTTEGLGFVGREEGIAVHSNCICYKVK